MTRHQTSRTRDNDDTPQLRLAPVRPQLHLTEQVTNRLSREIESGRLSPGSKLPTEHSLMQTFGVSRTVVREAVAALKAEGKVIARQGSGVYVASDARKIPFRIATTDHDAVAEALSIMELRLAIEVEAAALAAERGTAKDLQAIASAHRAFKKAVSEGDSAVTQDFAFHLAIAAATANPRFQDFLKFIGHHLIPRQVVRRLPESSEQRTAYLRRIATEHERINAALTERQSAEARAAMRVHLTNSLKRYRKLAVER